MAKLNFFKITKWAVFINFGIACLSILFLAYFYVFGVGIGSKLVSGEITYLDDFKKGYFIIESKNLDKENLDYNFDKNNSHHIQDLSGKYRIVSFDPGSSKFIIFHISMALSVLLYFLISFYLYKMINHTQPKSVFNYKNIAYLQRIAYTLVGYGIVKSIIDLNIINLKNQLLYEAGLSKSMSFVANFGIDTNHPIVFGILLLGIAQIFKQGVIIKDENELTI
jgi:hypothetical protein